MDVFHRGPINRFKCQTSAVGKGAVADGDIPETAITLRSQFDTPRWSVAVWSLLRVGCAGSIQE